MNTPRLLGNTDGIRALADRLASCRDVTKFDSGDEKEAWTIAHSFSDLEDACRKFTDTHLPRLANERLEPSEVNELLLEIGEELRHMMYHIRDPWFYRYLEPGPGDS